MDGNTLEGRRLDGCNQQTLTPFRYNILIEHAKKNISQVSYFFLEIVKKSCKLWVWWKDKLLVKKNDELHGQILKNWLNSPKLWRFDSIVEQLDDF